MRKLLDEQVDAPIVQPVITQQQSLFSMPLLGRVGYVFAGLGCPNGCDFCATSHYFKRRHIKFLPDGPSILRAIERLRGIYPEMVDIWINDEDFLLNEKRGRGFLEAIRKSDLPPLAVSIFSSVKALSRFKASELVEMGIDWVWVGYEGKRAGYAKMEGRPYRELFADLHDHGISVLASMIIGFDYQTPEIIQQEFDELMSMRPSMCQFLIYGPAHGTPAHERLKAEDRFRPEVMEDHTPAAHSALCPPRGARWSAGSLSSTAPMPPSLYTEYGRATRTPVVISAPLKMSTVTIETIPANAVKATIVAAVRYMPVVGEICPSVTMLRIQPPPLNW